MTRDASLASNDPPLVVDLDGTLVRADLTVESAFAHLGRDPARLLGLLPALRRGGAAVKAHIAAATPIDPASLPYDPEVLDLIRDARTAGRPVFLVSNADARHVAAVADHLGLFDGWLASNGSDDRSKAECLDARFGRGGFDYVGRGAVGGKAGTLARRRIAIDPSTSSRAWFRLLRMHQWAKNLLILVPLVTAQRFNLVSLTEAIGAFVAFSLAASSIYILNDLVDVEADRAHPSKKRRPLAAGTVPVRQALFAVPLLLAASLLLGLVIAPLFALVLVCYIALTTAYTFVLKRKMMIDVITLAGLYSVRVIGGAAAISVPVSEWLLAFALFIFTALALVKRYTELASLLDADLPDPLNRNYRKSDLGMVGALAAASAFNAVTVFAFYISSETVHRLYRHPLALWLICPILMYWLGRILLMADRRHLHEDPVVFALRDRNSLAAAALVAIILVGAI